MNENFWTRINELIKLNGLKQETVCQKCGINYQPFRGWIVRGTYPDALQTVKIAKLLDTSVEYLVTGERTSDAKLQEVKKLLTAIADSI